jgi:hypothetical protein
MTAASQEQGLLQITRTRGGKRNHLAIVVHTERWERIDNLFRSISFEEARENRTHSSACA